MKKEMESRSLGPLRQLIGVRGGKASWIALLLWPSGFLRRVMVMASNPS